MRKNRNKALYESIMSKVSRVVKKSLNEDRIASIGTDGGYYGSSPIFYIEEDEDGTLHYEFHPSGWDFDTTSQLEAAAVLASANRDEYINAKEFDSIDIVEPTDQDFEEAAYWLTGGNAMWQFHRDERFSGIWEEDKEDVVDCLKYPISEIVNSANNFGELVREFARKHADAYFINYIYEEFDELWDLYQSDYGDDRYHCPKCGSDNISYNTRRNTAYCDDCYWSGKYDELEYNEEVHECKHHKHRHMLSENKHSRHIPMRSKKALNENEDIDDDIYLDCTVQVNDKDFGLLTAAKLYWDGTINVRWVDEQGADCSGKLCAEDEDIIWDILKSIAH